mmetsp:Transcript_13564/g.29459  ORF Transcript_13564/g.29459 Transcript_13564/m.29459 type:complete len:243 (+) Transcript_13564:162-890(+)
MMEEEPWVEFGDGATNGDETGLWSLFQEQDKYQTFQYSFGDDDIRIRLKGRKAEDGQILKSTGLTVWRASSLLCDFLYENANIVKNKSVLELGAGVGLCGILAQKIGASTVILTDGDTDTLSQMRSNVARNIDAKQKSRNITCQQLIWGRKLDEFYRQWAPNDRGFDVVMGSDIVYIEDMVEQLFETVSRLLSTESSSVFLLSFARRNVSIDLVLSCAEKYGFASKKPKEKASEGVYLFFRT